MAQVDSSIYLQQQAPDIAGGITDGMKLSALANQRTNMQRDQQFQDAYRKSFVTDPVTGKVSFDATNLPTMAGIDGAQTYKVQSDMASQARNLQLQKVQDAMTMNKNYAQLIAPATDQASYDAGLQKIAKLGGDISEFPKEFDPTVVKAHIAQSLDLGQQLEQHWKDINQGNEVTKLATAQQEANAKSTEASAKMSDVSVKREDLALQRQKLYGGSGWAPGMPNGQPGGPIDPATLVPGMVPQSHQAKALEEIKDLQNVKNIYTPSIQAFDQAASEVRPMTGGLNTSLTALVPGMESPSQKAWQGMANTTVKDIEGTARQAAFDSLAKNYKPQFGDSDATIAQKRQGWIDYLKSHASAPTSKAYGIDLTKFNSTNLASADPSKTGGVQMRAPDGSVRLIPSDQVEAAKAAGGKQL